MLEYIYMCYGFTKNQYKNYQDTLLAEISLANPSLSREAQIREYFLELSFPAKYLFILSCIVTVLLLNK